MDEEEKEEENMEAPKSPNTMKLDRRKSKMIEKRWENVKLRSSNAKGSSDTPKSPTFVAGVKKVRLCFSLSFSLSLSLSFSYSLYLSITIFLTLYHTHTHSLLLTLSLSFSPFFLSLSFFLSL